MKIYIYKILPSSIRPRFPVIVSILFFIFLRIGMQRFKMPEEKSPTRVVYSFETR